MKTNKILPSANHNVAKKLYKMKVHKKIYYVGGIISLIFIPIIFWIYAKPIYDNFNLRVIDLGLPAKAKKGKKLSEYIIIPMEGYNYQTIKLPQNFDEKTENNYFALIKKLQKNNIDKTGIKFQLSDKNNFNDLVRLLNLMQKTEQDVYGLDIDKTNAFYVVHQKKTNSLLKDDVVRCGNVIGREYSDQNDYDFKHSNIIQKTLRYSPKEIIYLIAGFLILTYSSISRLLKFNRGTM